LLTTIHVGQEPIKHLFIHIHI